jgi:hypothetical protein
MEILTAPSIAVTAETPLTFEPYVNIPASTTLTFKVNLVVPYAKGYIPGTVTYQLVEGSTTAWNINVPFTGSASGKGQEYYGSTIELTLPEGSTTATLNVTTSGGTPSGTTVLQYEDADGSDDIIGTWSHSKG